MASVGRRARVRRRRIAAIAPVVALVAVAIVVMGLVAPRTWARSSGEGYEANPRSQVPAFVLNHGRYRSFEASDPAVQLVPGTITNRGVIVGEYLTPQRESGFRRGKRGRISRIDLPGVAGTQVDKINERGQIVGNYSDVSPFLPDEGSRGYILERGKVTKLDVPGADRTIPHDINDRGHVVGLYEDAAGRDHGFRWRHGRFTTFDVPGASSTEPIAINDSREIVGRYADADGAIHGFHLSHGRYTTFDAPGAPVTIPFDINDRGQIVVSSIAPTADDALAGARAFVMRRGVEGRFTELTYPGAPRTLAMGIDDRGRIVGIYENPNVVPGAQRSRVRPPTRAIWTSSTVASSGIDTFAANRGQ
jgi:probable HAF family extracellular repeat protein